MVTSRISSTSGPCRSAQVSVRPYPACTRSNRLRRLGPSRFLRRRRNTAHSIGVVVREMTIDVRIATDRVTANSRNSRPTMPPISKIGMNTAISDRLIETTVNPHLRRAAQGRFDPRHAFFDIALDILQHDDGVVDDEAGRHRQCHQRQVVQAIAQQIHRAERADDRDRHRDRRDDRRPQIAQEYEHHRRHQQHGDDQSPLRVVQRGADRRRPIGGRDDVDVMRHGGGQFRQLGIDPGPPYR